MIDVRTTAPLDKQTLIESAKKTSRAIVIDEGYESYGVTAEIASVIADGAFYYLDAPVKRMGAMDVPVPFSPVLEDQTVPTPETVAEMATRVVQQADDPMFFMRIAMVMSQRVPAVPNVSVSSSRSQTPDRFERSETVGTTWNVEL